MTTRSGCKRRRSRIFVMTCTILRMGMMAACHGIHSTETLLRVFTLMKAFQGRRRSSFRRIVGTKRTRRKSRRMIDSGSFIGITLIFRVILFGGRPLAPFFQSGPRMLFGGRFEADGATTQGRTSCTVIGAVPKGSTKGESTRTHGGWTSSFGQSLSRRLKETKV